MPYLGRCCETVELEERSRRMKFLVDEMPNFYDECPFSKEVWTDTGWKGICTLDDGWCNLDGNRCNHECYGLKKKGADKINEPA